MKRFDEIRRFYRDILNETMRSTLHFHSSVMTRLGLRGPTEYQIAVWEDEGGAVADCLDPLSQFRNKWWQKIHRYFRQSLVAE
ncbi:MAG: hypothetical protein V4736_07130 [Bdellovibrionota bacterium]